MKPMTPEERAAREERGERLRVALINYGQALKTLSAQLELETEALETLLAAMLITGTAPGLFAAQGQAALEKWVSSTQGSVTAERTADAVRLALLEVMKSPPKEPVHD